jgi:O-antigen ligase
MTAKLRAATDIWNLDGLRAAMAFLLGLSLPLSVTYSEILAGLAVLALMAERRPPAVGWRELRDNPVAVASIILFAVLGVATLYSTVPLGTAFRDWIRYRELLYLPIYMFLCRDDRARRAGLYGFGTALLAIMTFALVPLVPGSNDYVYRHVTGAYPADRAFASHVTEGMLVSFGAYLFALEAIRRPDHRRAALLLLACALLYMLLHNASRTGYLVLVALALTLVAQLAPRRFRLASLALVAVAAAGFLVLSPNLRLRMIAMGQEVVGGQEAVGGRAAPAGASAGADSQSADVTGAAGSARQHLQYLLLSTQAFLRHPWLGTGVGSFEQSYAALAVEHGLPTTTNPHNEYLMVAVQAGMVGLAALLGFFATLWRAAGRLPLWRGRQGQALTIAFALGCLFNSLLLDHIDGHSFAFLVSLFFGTAALRQSQGGESATQPAAAM